MHIAADHVDHLPYRLLRSLHGKKLVAPHREQVEAMGHQRRLSDEAEDEPRVGVADCGHLAVFT
jgi:hypothetical protein